MLKRFSFGQGPKKFKDKWQGPYLVVSVVNDVMYRIQVNDKGASKYKVVHFDRMKSYTGDNLPNWLSKTQKSLVEEKEVADSNNQSTPPSHDQIIGDVLAADGESQASASGTATQENQVNKGNQASEVSATNSAQSDPEPVPGQDTGRPKRNRKPPNWYKPTV